MSRFSHGQVQQNGLVELGVMTCSNVLEGTLSEMNSNMFAGVNVLVY